jgi:hypothetical protein
VLSLFSTYFIILFFLFIWGGEEKLIGDNKKHHKKTFRPPISFIMIIKILIIIKFFIKKFYKNLKIFVMRVRFERTAHSFQTIALPKPRRVTELSHHIFFQKN